MSIAAAVIISCFCFCYPWRKLKNKGTFVARWLESINCFQHVDTYILLVHICSDSGQTHQNLLLLDLHSKEPAYKKRTSVSNGGKDERNGHHELPIFSFSSIAASTDNFSTVNKLGEGGFGPVYKVILVLCLNVTFNSTCSYTYISLLLFHW